MEAHHTLRNAFSSDIDLPKSNIFPSTLTMVGSQVATKPWNFYSPEPLPLIATALVKFGSPGHPYVDCAEKNKSRGC